MPLRLFEQFIRLSSKAFIEEWELEEKFRLVASRLTAEALGFFLLLHNKEYPIVRIDRYHDDVFVSVALEPGKHLYAYRLPTAYAEMVVTDDEFKINSDQKRYSIFRVVQKCGWHRLPFDYKDFTWDLELRRISS